MKQSIIVNTADGRDKIDSQLREIMCKHNSFNIQGVGAGRSGVRSQTIFEQYEVSYDDQINLAKDVSQMDLVAQFRCHQMAAALCGTAPRWILKMETGLCGDMLSWRFKEEQIDEPANSAVKSPPVAGWQMANTFGTKYQILHKQEHVLSTQSYYPKKVKIKLGQFTFDWDGNTLKSSRSLFGQPSAKLKLTFNVDDTPIIETTNLICLNPDEAKTDKSGLSFMVGNGDVMQREVMQSLEITTAAEKGFVSCASLNFLIDGEVSAVNQIDVVVEFTPKHSCEVRVDVSRFKQIG